MRLKRHRDWKIQVCAKDSVPLQILKILLITDSEGFFVNNLSQT